MVAEDLIYALLALFEGEKLTAYKDTGGIWTIGIGHTGPDVHEGLTITCEMSGELCADDMAPLLGLTDHIADPYRQAALVSFGYNCGRGALQKVLDGQDKISNPAHTKDAKGNTLDWLVKRRRLESLLAGE